MNMEKPCRVDVLQALDNLYHAEDPANKEKASLWLMQLHSSVYAWTVADDLLLLKRDVETSYFAAQTMKNKVRFSFDELPVETHTDLRDSLINHLQQLCDAPAPIVRQLAMALADLALQMSDWKTVVTDLIQKFSQDLSTVSVLLDILIVLPEEINNRSLRLGQNRRKELHEEFGKNCPAVLSLLEACLTSYSGNSDVTTRIYACMGSWVQLGNFPGEALARSPLILAPFNTLKLLEVNPKLYEAAADCICSTLFMCEDSPLYYSLDQVLQVQVQELLPVFQAAVQSEDINRAKSLCHIFTEMAETFLYHMVHQPDIGFGELHTLDLLLECISHPDYEIADITFNVWYRLSEELQKQKDEKLYELFRPYIQRLIAQLCVHCQLDEDTSTTSVFSDDSDDFTTFRKNVVELVRDVIFLVGPFSCCVDLYSRICKPGTTWNVTEACLLMMYAVAPAIQRDESELFPIAVPVLLSIPPDSHYAIRATTLRLVGEIAEWIDQHPDTLDLVLSFILNGLNIPEVASFAAKAVQSVCLKCKQRMAPHINWLIQIIEAADKLSVSNDAVLGLLKGVVEVLIEMPPDVMTNGIRQLCSLHARFLQQLNEISDEAVPNGTHSDPTVWLDRLAVIFRSSILELKAGQEHPCTPVVCDLWPIVSRTSYKFKHNQRIVERTCRCIRFMIRSVGQGASPVLSSLMEMCVSIYRECGHSCYLYLGSVVVDEFGTNVVYQSLLVQFLQALAEVALPVLASTNGLINNPDTVDDLFRLCSRFIQRCPLAFFTSSVAGTVSQCALAAATLNHRDAFASVMKYLRDLIHLYHLIELEQQVRNFLSENGVNLMDALVTGFVSLPSVMISDSAEVLWELLNFAREDVCKGLHTSIEKLCTKRICVTVEQKSDFITAISKSSSTDELVASIKDFVRLYR